MKIYSPKFVELMPNNEKVFSLLSGSESGLSKDSADIDLIEFEPNTTTHPRVHATFTEYFYVIDGDGVVLLNETINVITSGQAFFVTPGTAHSFHTFASSLKLLAICVPRFNEDDNQLYRTE